MDVYDAARRRRSVRRFQQKTVSAEVLRSLVDAARVAPSAKNFQPLEYVIVTQPDLCDKLFETLGWAGYLKPSWSPAQKERPPAYIVMLVKREFDQYYQWDSGLAAAHIMLAAEAQGLGTCMLLNVNRIKVKELLNIPEQMATDAVISVGYKAEQPVIEDFQGDVKYWKDEQGTIHVPKRSLSSILHMNRYQS